jgi:hypothetical protein
MVAAAEDFVLLITFFRKKGRLHRKKGNTHFYLPLFVPYFPFFLLFFFLAAFTFFFNDGEQ